MRSRTDNFVGSKSGSGIAQWIISEMPVHRTYVECFLGKGVIMRTKLPASRNIGIELDPIVISRYHRRYAKLLVADMANSTARHGVIGGDCLAVLPALKLDSTALVYADPPYPGSVRADRDRVYYGKEMLSWEEHVALLAMLLDIGKPDSGCMVILSGYRNDLYCRLLHKWRMETKWTITRGGTRVEECLWLNFPKPALLHDSRFIGSDFTDRQAIKRKIERWRKKFAAQTPDVRFALLEAMQSVAEKTQSHVSAPAARPRRASCPEFNCISDSEVSKIGRSDRSAAKVQ